MDKEKLKIDLLKFLLILKEEKRKKYIPNFYEDRVIYIFENNKEFYDYFKSYGIKKDKNTLDLLKYSVLEDGRVVALKKNCDNLIQNYLTGELEERLSILDKQLTPEKIEEIHSRNKITYREKVSEWESMDLCAPGDYASSAAYRCHTFNNCHECLLDFASSSLEYDKFEFKLIHLPYPSETPKKKSLSKDNKN